MVYCGKINSQFCLPAVDFNGFASLQRERVHALGRQPPQQKSGLLFYGYQANASPFRRRCASRAADPPHGDHVSGGSERQRCSHLPSISTRTSERRRPR